MLYKTIFHKIKNLPENLLVLPGHDYLYNNILFLESLYEDSTKIDMELIQLKENFNEHDLSPIRDLIFEKKHNPFFRIDQYSFLDLIKNKNLFENEEIQFRFKLLRRFRDEW
jgi:hydroxyacylglutathione hydrolase